MLSLLAGQNWREEICLICIWWIIQQIGSSCSVSFIQYAKNVPRHFENEMCSRNTRRKEDRHPLQVIASFSRIKYNQNPHRPLEWFDTLVNKILLKNSAMWRDDDIRSSHCGRSSGEQTSAIKVSSWILELIPGKFHSKHHPGACQTFQRRKFRGFQLETKMCCNLNV